jgi:hypothetical protein
MAAGRRPARGASRGSARRSRAVPACVPLSTTRRLRASYLILRSIKLIRQIAKTGVPARVSDRMYCEHVFDHEWPPKHGIVESAAKTNRCLSFIAGTTTTSGGASLVGRPTRPPTTSATSSDDKYRTRHGRKRFSSGTRASRLGSHALTVDSFFILSRCIGTTYLGPRRTQTWEIWQDEGIAGVSWRKLRNAN